MAEQWPELADGTPVTATMRNGGLTPSDPGTVEEWLKFNASVRRAGERKGRLSFPSGVASSEAEMRGAVKGLSGEPSSEAEIVPRVRGGCRWAALGTWAAYWASLSPFLSSGLEGGCRPSWARFA